tara:strand:+ start:476 stop:721 length:246 start_codon:yes stop_codon:yes gene_type:complete
MENIGVIMRKAKTNKMERKKRAQQHNKTKTAKSRAKRLENRTKREALLNIDPLANITIVDGNTYIDGAHVIIKNNKIVKEI